MASNVRAHQFLILLLLSLISLPTSSHAIIGKADASMRPLSVKSEIRRQMLGSFKVCGVCTCCGGLRRVCVQSPCCYVINCSIPNRPFGVCAFTPKACNCFGCHS